MPSALARRGGEGDGVRSGVAAGVGGGTVVATDAVLVVVSLLLDVRGLVGLGGRGHAVQRLRDVDVLDRGGLRGRTL